MPDYQYKALEAGGRVATGELTASDRGDAFRQLERKGLRPVKVTEINAPAKAEKSPIRQKTSTPGKKSTLEVVENEPIYGDELRLKKSEIILFTEELSDMLSSGLQLEPALRVLENRSDQGHIKEVSARLRALVRDGMGFNVALRKVSPSFGPLYCALASAGEASGSLDKILKRQAEHMVAVQNIQNQVAGALAYPAFVLLMAMGVCVFVLFGLLPQLVGLMQGMPGAKIPGLATFLMDFTAFIKSSWYWIVIGVAVAAFSFKIWKDSPANRMTWDEFKMKAPLVGGLISANFYVLFMETMANLIANGLPLVRALELTRNATQNLYAQTKLDTLIAQVGDGRALSQSMYRTELFPPVIIDMIVVGEQTGHLDNAMSNAARRSDKELNMTVKRLMGLLTPVIIIILALVILTVLYLIFSLIGETIQGIRR